MRAQLAEFDALDARSVGDWAQVVRHERRRIAILEAGLETSPGHRHLRLIQGVALSRLARGLERTFALDQADAALERSDEVIDELVRSFPAWVDPFQASLEIPGMRAQLAIRRGDVDAALQHGGECVERWRAADGKTELRDVGLATAMGNLANTIIMVGLEDEESMRRAEGLATEALGLTAKLGDALPNPWMGCTLHYNRAVPRSRLGDLTGAARDLRLAEEALRERDAAPAMLRMLADGWAEQRLAAKGVDKAAVARAEARLFELLEEAVKSGYADAREISTNSALDDLREDPRYVRVLSSIQ